MINKTFNYDLDTICTEVNSIVRQYREEGTSKMQKNFLVEDLIALTKELTENYCKKYIRKYTITDITLEELYAVAISNPLVDALRWFDFSQGDNFMKAWYCFMIKRFNNELKRISTNKATYYRNNFSSSDKVIGSESGSTILDMVGQEDFAEKTCEKMTLLSFIEAFENMDKHGKVIRCLAIQSQRERTEAFMAVLGVDKYGDAERKQVSRAKKRFKDFIVSQGYKR